jgi:hypothetical protein
MRRGDQGDPKGGSAAGLRSPEHFRQPNGTAADSTTRRQQATEEIGEGREHQSSQWLTVNA